MGVMSMNEMSPYSRCFKRETSRCLVVMKVHACFAVGYIDNNN